MNTRNARFFRWFRTIPLLCMALMLALSIGVDYLPKDMVRSLFFPVTYAERIDDAAERYGVDEHLIAAVIRCESGWNDTAQSKAGAVGLMQIMPDTAKSLTELKLVDTNRFDPNNLTDPATNIEYGTAQLSYLQDQFATTDQVIAAYNAGLGTVQKWVDQSGNEDFLQAVSYPETQHYIERVNEATRQYAKYYPNGMSVV